MTLNENRGKMSENKLAIAITENTATEISDSVEMALGGCEIEKLSQMPMIKQAVAVANCVHALRKIISVEVVKHLFMPLQGTALGFMADKDYPPEIVRDCVIEAMIKGFRPVNNEFNIISGRAYFAKNGFDRKVRELPGLTDLNLKPGAVEMIGGAALVSYRARWLLDGEVMTLEKTNTQEDDYRIPVKANSGMGHDAILGKAKRKMLAAVYDLISGSSLSLDDGDAIDAQGSPVPERRAARPELVSGASSEMLSQALSRINGSSTNEELEMELALVSKSQPWSPEQRKKIMNAAQSKREALK